MKAVVSRGAGKLACEEVPLPDLPADGLLLRVTACGICGGDLRAYRHGMRGNRDNQILGHEVAGVVHAVGAEVTGYSVGERLALAADVSCNACYYCKRALYNLCDHWKLLGLDFPGGMAEYMVLTSEILRGGIINRIPATLSDIHATLAEPYSSVIWSQKELDIQPSEVVAILGDGPMGALHVQVANLRGAKPVMIGITGPRLEMFRNPALGAWKVLDNLTQDVPAEMRALTGGRGADVAIVANPFKQTQAQAVELVRKRGRVSLFGGVPKDDPITQFDSNMIHYREITVMGNFSYHPSAHAIALDLLDRNLLGADLIATATFPFARAIEAFDTALRGDELKVVLTP